MIKNLFLGALCFFGTLGFGVTKAVEKNNDSNVVMSATFDNIYYDCFIEDNYLGDYFKNKYSSLIRYEEIKTERKTIPNVRNFYQNYLNNYYNEKYNLTNEDNMITGTCGMVACAIMVNYFGKTRGEFPINETDKDMFVKIFDACLAEGYTSIKSGTDKDDLDDCVDVSFSSYGSKRTGNTNWWYLEDNIRDAVNGNTPILLALYDHECVVVGVTKFGVTYEKTYTTGMWWWEKTITEIVTETEEFVIVNDGNGGEVYGGLVPFSMITNYQKGMQVTWAEL